MVFLRSLTTFNLCVAALIGSALANPAPFIDKVNTQLAVSSNRDSAGVTHLAYTVHRRDDLIDEVDGQVKAIRLTDLILDFDVKDAQESKAVPVLNCNGNSVGLGVSQVKVNAKKVLILPAGDQQNQQELEKALSVGIVSVQLFVQAYKTIPHNGDKSAITTTILILSRVTEVDGVQIVRSDVQHHIIQIGEYGNVTKFEPAVVDRKVIGTIVGSDASLSTEEQLKRLNEALSKQLSGLLPASEGEDTYGDDSTVYDWLKPFGFMAQFLIVSLLGFAAGALTILVVRVISYGIDVTKGRFQAMPPTYEAVSGMEKDIKTMKADLESPVVQDTKIDLA